MKMHQIKMFGRVRRGIQAIQQGAHRYCEGTSSIHDCQYDPCEWSRQALEDLAELQKSFPKEPESK